MKISISLLLAMVILVVIAINSGVYNIAATEKHWAITEKIITWVRVSSIATRAKDLQVPTLNDSSMLLTGAEHYEAMCTNCHLTPGQEPTELAAGLYPQAPVFHRRTPITNKENRLEQAKEYFWVIKNGLKMTAMPAWGLTHDDETVWAMVAFVQKLAGMTSNEYAEFTSVRNKIHNHNHDHNGNHHHD
ncbi:MAG: cytochrome c [Nitrosomonas sp.]|nr:cytochrome c [Nitrosomonas sp.]